LPSTSVAQRRLFAIASHHPEQLYDKNKGLAKLPHQTLHDFAATSEKGLPKRVPHMADGGAWWQRETVRGFTPHMADGGRLSDAFDRAGEKGHSLHASLGIPKEETIPAYRVRAAAHSGTPKIRHQAQAALNMNKGFYARK